MSWYCMYLFLFILFRSNVRKGYLDESDFRHCSGNLFQSAIPKSQLNSSLFLTITRYINYNILKDTLQLKILRTWIKIRANSFIKTLVNIMKRKSKKVPGKLSFVKKYEPALQWTLHQSKWYFICYYPLFFLFYLLTYWIAFDTVIIFL